MGLIFEEVCPFVATVLSWCSHGGTPRSMFRCTVQSKVNRNPSKVAVFTRTTSVYSIFRKMELFHWVISTRD